MRWWVLAVCIAVLTSGGAALPSTDALRADGAAEVQDVFLRAPRNPPRNQPLQAVVALHGMGGNGRDFGLDLAGEADQYNWLIIAPTINYGDWTDPKQIAHEDPSLAAWLWDEIAHLHERTGYDIRPTVLLFGHSRGAQLALRFTEIHPEQVAGVAAVSAGTYTLPLAADGRGNALEFPYGIADLASDDGGRAFESQDFDGVPVWLGVGAADNNPADVPAAWSPYMGNNRVTRARTFARTLRAQGADVALRVFPNSDHTLTDAMRAAGSAALQADVTG